MFNWLKPKTIILLRFETGEGWDLLGVYSDRELADEGLMQATRNPEFKDGVFSMDEMPFNTFWPDTFGGV